LSMNKKY